MSRFWIFIFICAGLAIPAYFGVFSWREAAYSASLAALTLFIQLFFGEDA